MREDGLILWAKRLLSRFCGKQAGTRLEKAAATLLGVLGFVFLLSLEIGEIGTAEWASDRLKVEAEIVHDAVVERFQQIAAELFACRATKALAPPDRADRMFAAVAFLHHQLQLLTQCLRSSQRLLNLRGLGFGQGVVEIGVHLFAG